MVIKDIDDEIIEVIKKYIDKISKIYNLDSVFLFGSYAKGNQNESSDIDIAIISDDFIDIIDDGANLIGLTWKIDTRIEPHPITKAEFEKVDSPLIKEIKETGIKVA